MSNRKIEWVKENDAANMIGVKPATLRRRAKAHRYPINYTSLNQRRYQYSKEDIENMLLNNSTIPLSKKKAS